MFIRTMMWLQAAAAVTLMGATAQAQEAVKIGLIVPMTGGPTGLH